jgi:hypothetical protein
MRWCQSVREHPTLNPCCWQDASPLSCCPAGTAPRGGCTSLRDVASPPGLTTSRRLVSASSALRAGTVRPSKSGHLADTEVMALIHEQLSRFATSIGRGAAPVWCHPRRREEAERNPRASSEAGTRRMQVKWSPTYGYEQDQPTDVPGSGSSDGPLHREDITMKNTD